MRTIWKFPLVFDHTNDCAEIKLPTEAEVIHVEIQNGNYTLWAIVDSEHETFARHFYVFGTGHPLRTSACKDSHVATIQDGEFVWHIFESPRPASA